MKFRLCRDGPMSVCALHDAYCHYAVGGIVIPTVLTRSDIEPGKASTACDAHKVMVHG